MRPKVAVAAVLRSPDNQVLLIQRGHPPEMGRWAVPGGHVEAGERYDHALVRETREETGLAIVVGPLLFVSELITENDRWLILDFAATAESGEPLGQAASDAKRLGYFSFAQCQALDLASGMAELLTDSQVRGYLQWE